MRNINNLTNKHDLGRLSQLLRQIATELTIYTTEEIPDDEAEKIHSELERQRNQLANHVYSENEVKNYVLKLLKSKRNEMKIAKARAELALDAAKMDLQKAQSELKSIELIIQQFEK
jgi:MoxR-like ATPase